MHPTLYEQDYYLWLEQTAKHLDAGDWHQVDVANLVEEIRDMGRSEKQALESNLTIVLFHLLKYKYQPSRRTRSWLLSIAEHRRRLKKQLKDSPSLRSYIEQVFQECYDDAIRLAEAETGLPRTAFPTESPFAIAQTLDFDYLPEDTKIQTGFPLPNENSNNDLGEEF
jgi:Domain of unknown function DUF29